MEEQVLLQEEVHMHHYRYKEEHMDRLNTPLSRLSLMKPKGLLLAALHFRLTMQAKHKHKYTLIIKLYKITLNLEMFPQLTIKYLNFILFRGFLVTNNPNYQLIYIISGVNSKISNFSSERDVKVS